MKKTILVLSLVSGIFCHVKAQVGSTIYGDGAYASGDYNSYFGFDISIFGTGNNNTVVGSEALTYGGTQSTAVGREALRGGVGCTAIGYWALKINRRPYQDYMTPQSGDYNTGVGFKCLQSNTVGDYNTAVGTESLYSNTASQNVAVGYHSMHANVDGSRNSAIGTYSMYSNLGYDNTANGHRSLYANTTGSYNTAIGSMSLYINVSGDMNTANGYSALYGNTTGSNNTATGTYSLYGNTTGTYNTATGRSALSVNSTGHYNTANGYSSLYFNGSGAYNTANGSQALYTNATGTYNTASGYRALFSSTADYNTATGSHCMNANTTGNYNTAAGYYALADNTTGSRNSADGLRALDNNTTGSYNTAQGGHALNYLNTGNYNSALGYYAGPTLTDLNNTTAIGYLAVPTASNQVRIGNTSVTSIGGQEEWTAFSDGRFKKDIKEDVSGLEFISQLRPVSYTVDKAKLNEFLHVRDSSSQQAEAKSLTVRKTGFIAQEVEALIKKTGYVFSGVDAPENDDDPYGIRYSEFVVPLVKGMQELVAIIKEHERKDEEQQKQIDSLSRQLGSRSQNEFGSNSAAVLFQNNPNPFDAETSIQMTVPDNVGYATVMVYNLEGKQLKTIQVPERGDIHVTISANDLSAGMYLYSLIADGKVVDTKRMVLTK